jgi:uncharacterized membrane protein
MALLPSQAGERFPATCASVFRLCALFALHLFSSISAAGEIEELSATEAGGEYRLRIVSVLDAPADYVYNVITDYKHVYRISPTITEVEILSSDSDEVVRVRHRSEHWVGPFRFKIEWMGDIVETTKYRRIKVTTIPEFSSFESGSAIWEIRPQGERTWVLHESSLKPKFFIPPIIGVYIMKKHMLDESTAIFNRIECNAMIAFEMDMEHEIEQLKILLKKGKVCTNPHEDGPNLSLETK